MSKDAPRIGFLIGGVQKAGTSALAGYLSAHPALALPRGKEAHVFDAPDFDGWDRPRIEREYAAHFAGFGDGRLHGDATPIYLFHETLIARIAAYNPAMRWIVLLRDPVARAISHYRMERARGAERWPLWAALLLERWRLRGHRDDFGHGSPLRHHSYVARCDYVGQLATLRAHFPESQLLIVHNRDLRHRHVETLARVCDFLQVPRFDPAPAPVAVFEGPPLRVSPPTRALARWLLHRQRQEYARM